MKRRFSLLMLCLVMAVTAFAQSRRYAMLKLRLSDQSPISVYLDGRFIDRGTNSLTLDGIRPGFHRLEVYSEAGYRRRPVRIYTGNIRLQPATVNIGVVDVYNRALRLRTRPMEGREYSEDRDDRGDRRREYPKDNRDDFDGQGQDYGKDRDDIYGNGSDNADGTDSGEGYGSFPHGRGNASSYDGNGFTERDMDDLHSRVAGRITDSDKEQLMKSALDGRTVYTDQVRQMLGWLSFDDTKLDFAKWAYKLAGDKQNYWKLEDAFSFESSKEEFSKAIRER